MIVKYLNINRGEYKVISGVNKIVCMGNLFFALKNKHNDTICLVEQNDIVEIKEENV